MRISDCGFVLFIEKRFFRLSADPIEQHESAIQNPLFNYTPPDERGQIGNPQTTIQLHSTRSKRTKSAIKIGNPKSTIPLHPDPMKEDKSAIRNPQSEISHAILPQRLGDMRDKYEPVVGLEIHVNSRLIRRSSAGVRRDLVTSPIRTLARSVWDCPARCRCSIAGSSNLLRERRLLLTCTSTPSRSSRAKTTFTPTCPRVIRFHSTTGPSQSTGGLRFRPLNATSPGTR